MRTSISPRAPAIAGLIVALGACATNDGTRADEPNDGLIPALMDVLAGAGDAAETADPEAVDEDGAAEDPAPPAEATTAITAPEAVAAAPPPAPAAPPTAPSPAATAAPPPAPIEPPPEKPRAPIDPALPQVSVPPPATLSLTLEAPVLNRPTAAGTKVATLAAGTTVEVMDSTTNRAGYWLWVRAGTVGSGWLRAGPVRP